LTIELGRFSDRKRLKVIRKLSKTDSNVRVSGSDITIVSTVDEVKLENDAIEAVNFWNSMLLCPDLKEKIHKILNGHL
jgi:KaiC/GvpD/RAD55 family RecA-like ATPase